MARRMVCLKSKAAILILIWTFSMAILQGITFSNTYSLIYIYLINLFVCLFGVLAYMWTARKFKRRQRHEPDNIYRYAEEYYSKIED